jgi:cellulose synthase/poly-beta-1,6-N-acetylglucosamine synthase-like glycosyltransferase
VRFEAASHRSQSEPPFSVLVIAHDQRAFLKEAVESVLSQDIDRSLYEIIVVKNFRDDPIDQFLERAGAQNILSGETSGAPKVVEGFRRSRGRVICILDYDDMFEPNRLRTILTEFDADPNLGLYRNQLSFIGPEGEAIHGRALGPHRHKTLRLAGRIHMTDENKAAEIRKVAGKHPEFNNSTFAVRREILEDVYPYLARLVITVDTLLFYATLCSSWSILLDDRQLTRYRVHGLNTTVSGNAGTKESLERLATFATISDHDYRVIRELVVSSHREFALRQFDARILVNETTLAMRAPTFGRKTFARLFLELIRHADTYPVRENVYSVLASLFFTVSPSVARTFYARAISSG